MYVSGSPSSNRQSPDNSQTISVGASFPTSNFTSLRHLSSAVSTTWKTEVDSSGDAIHQLRQQASSFENPELIDDGPETAPSKRLLVAFGKRYKKVTFGSLITGKIGIPALREKCPHFNDWITRLENVPPAAGK